MLNGELGHHWGELGEVKMNKIEEIFSDCFEKWNIQLPVDALQSGQAGNIQSHGWLIQYKFGSNERGIYLDFYASNKMTNDQHWRIYESGEMEPLPAYLEMITVYPPNATEEEKEEIRLKNRLHDEEVTKLLKKKGFL